MLKETIFSKFREKKLGVLIPIFLTILYISVWSTILSVYAYTFHLGIFDYGFDIQQIAKESSIFGFNFAGTWYIPFFNPNRLVTFLFVPFFIIIRSSYFLIFAESFIFGISGYLIFLIFFELLSDRKYAAIGQIMWYIYYPNNASNFFVFHFLTIYAPLFLLGIYFYIKNRDLYGGLTLGLSSFTVLLAPIINLFTIITLILFKKRYGKKGDGKNFVNSLLIILTLSSLVLIINSTIAGGSEFLAGARLPSQASASSGTIVTIMLGRLKLPILSKNLLYVLMDFLPLIFLPLIETTFIFSIIPVVIYFIFGNSIGLPFYYPGQWVPLYSPQIFIAFALILKKRRIYKGVLSNRITPLLKKVRNSHLIGAALIINLLLFTIYSPLGPANHLLIHEPNNNPPSNGNYNLYANLNIKQYDINLNNMASLIPLNASVLTQFNMATLSNRFDIYYPGSYNYSMETQYLLNNPYTDPYWFTTGTGDTVPSYPGTMMSFSNTLLSNSSYGVLGESQGALLLKENYHSVPKFYVPFNISDNYSLNSSGEANLTILLPPGNLMFDLTGDGNSLLKLGNTTLYSSGGTSSQNSSLYLPFYGQYTFTIYGTEGKHTLMINQTAPARFFNYDTSNFIPNTAHSFNSNLTNTESYSITANNISNTSISYAYWVNLGTFEDGLNYSTNKGNDSFVMGSNGFGFWNQIKNNGYFEFGLHTRVNTSYLSPFKIGTDHWFFVSLTYGRGYVSLYLNGVLVYSEQIFTGTIDLNYGNSTNLIFGAIHPFLVNGKFVPNTNPFNGTISDFVLYNNVLSPYEILTLYKSGNSAVALHPLLQLFY